MIFLWIFIIGLILFIIIVNAVKIGVREALFEFKEDIIKEFRLKELMEKQTGIGNSDVSEAGNTPADSVPADINHRDVE